MHLWLNLFCKMSLSGQISPGKTGGHLADTFISSPHRRVPCGMFYKNTFMTKGHRAVPINGYAEKL